MFVNVRHARFKTTRDVREIFNHLTIDSGDAENCANWFIAFPNFSLQLTLEAESSPNNEEISQQIF